LTTYIIRRLVIADFIRSAELLFTILKTN